MAYWCWVLWLPLLEKKKKGLCFSYYQPFPSCTRMHNLLLMESSLESGFFLSSISSFSFWGHSSQFKNTPLIFPFYYILPDLTLISRCCTFFFSLFRKLSKSILILEISNSSCYILSWTNFFQAFYSHGFTEAALLKASNNHHIAMLKGQF